MGRGEGGEVRVGRMGEDSACVVLPNHGFLASDLPL